MNSFWTRRALARRRVLLTRGFLLRGRLRSPGWRCTFFLIGGNVLGNDNWCEFLCHRRLKSCECWESDPREEPCSECHRFSLR